MKRKINLDFDLKPSVGHRVNAKLVSKYIKKGSLILDVGCWSGQLLRALKSERKNFHYFGIDVNKDAIGYITKVEPEGNFKLASALDIPYKDKYFDIITLFDVLEHIPKKAEMRCLKEIRRVIKKDGVLLISTPADNLFSKIFDPAYFLLEHRHYSKDKLLDLLSKSRFKVRSFTTTGSVFYGLYILLQLFFKHIFNSDCPNRGIFKVLEQMAQKELSRSGFMGHYIISYAE